MKMIKTHKKSFLKNKLISKIVVGILVLLFVFTPVIALNYYIPNDIKFSVGQRHNLKYKIPLEAEIISGEYQVLKIDNNLVTKSNKNISINKPFTVETNQTGMYNLKLKLFGLIPIKNVKVEVVEDCELIACGETIGIELKTKGVLVLGTGEVVIENGVKIAPSKERLFTGDSILSINGELITSKEDMVEELSSNKGEEIKLDVLREGQMLTQVIKPEKSIKDGKYKVGIWVRDSTQGIGTITYINPEKMTFGALGHGITDIDTSMLIPIAEGIITNANIINIKKGDKGEPGEIEGTLAKDEEDLMGTLNLNTNKGVFGQITKKDCELLDRRVYSVAFEQEVKEGNALVLTNIDGKGIKEYNIEIKKIYYNGLESAKGMIVEITDERLLNITNGIVQGMSGSPIIQNDKIIGAITHVFVQNPRKGYGVYIEDMLIQEKTLK